MDKHRRSLAKTISWRVVATLTTAILIYMFTSSAILSFGIGMMDLMLKSVFYYAHERIWNRIGWGRKLQQY